VACRSGIIGRVAGPDPTGGEHERRARSFGQVARSYHRYRPRTPDELLPWLLPEGATAVLDLAAGTGALTERLVPRVRQVIAVEPDPGMRSVLAESAPSARVLDGSAEKIPLPDASVDAVLVGSAWHWFDAPRAAAEIARVLRDGGRLALVGNSPDHDVAWVAEMRRPLSSATQPDPRPRDVLGVTLPAGAPFGPVDSRELRWTWPLPVADVVGLLETYSNVITADESRRASLREHTLAVLAAEPTTSGRAVVDLPMVSRGQRATRLPRA
jgi:SAM-dependent methyltransferase